MTYRHCLFSLLTSPSLTIKPIDSPNISRHSSRTMSTSYASSSPISLSTFHLSFREAIRTYHKRTKNDLLLHPLAPLFQSCNDPVVALSLLQRHAQVSSRHRISNEQLKSLLTPTLIGLYAISSIGDEGVGIVIVELCSFMTCIYFRAFLGIITREGYFSCYWYPPFSEDLP